MSKLISNLPPGLKQLAEKRRAESDRSYNGDNLFDAFSWAKTPEGGSFWLSVLDGCYGPYYGVTFRPTFKGPLVHGKSYVLRNRDVVPVEKYRHLEKYFTHGYMYEWDSVGRESTSKEFDIIREI